MSNTDQPLKDIRSTGDEAQRWLDALESDQDHSPADAGPVVPITHSQAQTESFATRDQAHPGLIILIIAILTSPLILLAVYQSGRGSLSSSSMPTPLVYNTSCGSPGSSTGRWWPVLGAADPSLLSTVRSRFCGDAYINVEGALQVASFGSWEDAEAFRVRIEQATGQKFRVGLGRVPVE